MSDTKISALPNSTAVPVATDAFVTVESMGGSPATKRKAASAILGWIPIASLTISSPATIDFTSIAGTWTQLVVIFGGLRTNTTAGGTLQARLNNISTGSYYFNGIWMLYSSATVNGYNGNAVAQFDLGGGQLSVAASNASASYCQEGMFVVNNPSNATYQPSVSWDTQGNFAVVSSCNGGGAFGTPSVTRITLFTGVSPYSFSSGWAKLYGVL